jgi:hypothetical protein
MANPVYASKTQVNAMLNALHHTNHRVIQPLHGRGVTTGQLALRGYDHLHFIVSDIEDAEHCVIIVDDEDYEGVSSEKIKCEGNSNSTCFVSQ